MNTVTLSEQPRTKQLCLVKVGTFLKLNNGHIALRTTDGFFDLSSGTDHTHVWEHGEELPKGSTLTITIGAVFDLTHYQVERVKELLRVNKKIDAINYVRGITSVGLLDAKNYVDSLNTPELNMEEVLGHNQSKQTDDESPW